MMEGFKAPSERLLRLSQVLSPEGPIPVSKSTWWRGVKSGRYPQPIKIGMRITVWRESDINGLFKDNE
ncbi:AlpA family phage regulatory protein [Xanthobacter sp. VTT E-85241]|uniref:helix-turn-helix transcriptional regulator n=1 Tax=Roseixanthobacter finlandensis TaxID=3119922 RepID=UPI0037269262